MRGVKKKKYNIEVKEPIMSWARKEMKGEKEMI
jgi:hypothetical protein